MVARVYAHGHGHGHGMHMVAGALVLQRPANQLVLLLRAQEQAIYDPLIPSMHVHLFSHRAVYPSPNLCLPISLPTRLTTGIGQLALARHLQAARAATTCERPQCAAGEGKEAGEGHAVWDRRFVHALSCKRRDLYTRYFLKG